MGTESEYLIYEVQGSEPWILQDSDQWRPLSHEDLVSVLAQVASHNVSIFSGERLWLANGACVYIDGQLLEYATPECFASVTAAAAEHAGRVIIGEACGRAQNATGKNLVTFARCSGPDGLEAGYHENYGLPLSNTSICSIIRSGLSRSSLNQ